MSQYIIGLTGGIGSGKTTVAHFFEKLGVEVIDADVIARQVVEPGSDGLKSIEAHFGSRVILESGALDRQKLRQIIFENEAEKTWLNRQLHPIIRTRMIAQTKAAHSTYCILAVPLLIENQLTSLVDRVLITDCKPDTQVSRASHRDNNSAEQIRQIMAAQLDRETRINYADDIIDTELPLSEVEHLCHKLHHNYLNLALNRSKN